MAMNPGVKMLMMDRVRKSPESNYRSEYGGGNRRMIGYDRDYEKENSRRMEGNRMAYGMDEPESRRRRDSRGRYMESEGWQGNRGYPESRYEPESRRRRDSRGRYMMDGNRMDADYEDDDDDVHARSQTWYPPYGNASMHNVPPMNMHPGNSYGDIYAHGSIYAPGAMNKPMGGMMGGDMSAPVDEHTARMWVGRMSGGEHFKVEQTEQQRMAVCPDCDRWEWFVAMNAMYSDHCETAKKMNIDRPDYYAHMARDFLKDTDAKPHKLRRYMEHIAA